MNWQMFWQIAPTLVSLVVLIVGWVYALGRMRAIMVTKEMLDKQIVNIKQEMLDHCVATQQKCSSGVGTKIDDLKGFVIDLKNLVIDLHDKQGVKIEQMDKKREDAKDEANKIFSDINKAIGRIEGRLTKNGNGSG